MQVNYIYICNTVKTLIKSTDIFKLSELTFWQTKELYRIVGYVTSEHALKHPDVQRLLHADNLHYDLILTEQYYQDALLCPQVQGADGQHL